MVEPKPTEQKTKHYSSHEEVAKVTLWAAENKSRLVDKEVTEIHSMVVEALGFPVTRDCIRKVLGALGLLKAPVKKIPMEKRWEILARAIVKIYAQLGETVPDDLWEAMGGKGEEDA